MNGLDLLIGTFRHEQVLIRTFPDMSPHDIFNRLPVDPGGLGKSSDNGRIPHDLRRVLSSKDGLQRESLTISFTGLHQKLPLHSHEPGGGAVLSFPG